MQLETYISDLLYRYQCVVVPDFGAFLSQPVSAKINPTNHTFYPPKKQLSFNKNIQQNDGILANYIAEIERISVEVALQKIKKRVSVLKTYLNEGKTISFINIGALRLNEAQHIVFEPSYHLNYLTEAFGLSPFVSPAINRLPKESLQPVLKTTSEYSTNNKNRYWRYAAIAVMALAIGGLATSYIYKNNIDLHNLKVQQVANSVLDKKIQEATFVIKNPLPAATIMLTKASGPFHIVAGAFRVEENAQTKVLQLIQKGYSARNIGVNKYGLHEVVYESYNNREDALKALSKIKNTQNSEAWLLVKPSSK